MMSIHWRYRNCSWMMRERIWSKRSTSMAKRNALVFWKFCNLPTWFRRWIPSHFSLNQLAFHRSFFNCSSIDKQLFIQRSNSKLDWLAHNRWMYVSCCLLLHTFSSIFHSRSIGYSMGHRFWIFRVIHDINNTLLMTRILWRSMMFPTRMLVDTRWTQRTRGAKRHAPLNCLFHPRQQWLVSIVVVWTRPQHAMLLHALCRSDHISLTEWS